MNRDFISNFYKISIAVLGFLCFVLALFYLKSDVLSWQFLLFFLCAALIAPRMSLTLPRSRFILSFSDSMIFLTFLLFGGEAAVIIATIERFASCLYLKYKGAEFKRYTLIFNVGSVSVSTGITFFIWVLLPQIIHIAPNSSSTTNLITVLGILALTQFLSDSVFASIFHTLKTNTTFWNAWKKEGISISMTHFAGAGLAGIIFKLLNYGDVFSIGISLVIFAFVYFTYRHIIAEMTKSIDQAEQAERDKAEAERGKRIEVEKYAEDLAIALKKEEETGKALRKSRRAFQHAALHDSLTKLPNRAYFGEILGEIIAKNKENTDCQDCYVLFLDLARFKTINDSLGHTIGDKVLILVAKRFLRMLGQTDFVARLGGDEFAIVLNNLENARKAEQVAWNIHQKISQSFSISGNKINIGINIGIAPCTFEYDTPEDVLRDADIAMHYAKERGSGVEIFSKDLRRQFIQRAQIESELPFAIERGEFAIHYQPIISLKDGSLIGVEALLRWFHRERGLISPAEFIPIAEDTGHIVPITTWILKETCSQLSKWQKLSYANRQLIVSVNISGKHLSYQSLLVDVEMALEGTKLSPSSLKLEITESAAMENAEQTIRMLSHLKSLGVQLSIDDFGTGYSSLSYLHRLPVDTLKIDRSFVNSVGENGEDSEILQTIISLAKNLKMRVIAEGIETESQLNILKNLGCDYGQGYLMSKPLPKDALEDLLYHKQNWLPSKPEDSVSHITEITKDENIPSF
jgi:diguanylate cyclase (GGDEF)-like protein